MIALLRGHKFPFRVLPSLELANSSRPRQPAQQLSHRLALLAE